MYSILVQYFIEYIVYIVFLYNIFYKVIMKYWLYSIYWTLHLYLIYFTSRSFLFNPLWLYFPSHYFSPLWIISFSLCFIIFVHLFFFLRFHISVKTYRLFSAMPWLISLSVMLLFHPPVPLQKANSILYGWGIFYIVYVCLEYYVVHM